MISNIQLDRILHRRPHREEQRFPTISQRMTAASTMETKTMDIKALRRPLMLSRVCPDTLPKRL